MLRELAFLSLVAAAAAQCGNGQLDAGEECDWNSTDVSIGSPTSCSGQCQFYPPSPPIAPAPFFPFSDFDRQVWIKYTILAGTFAFCSGLFALWVVCLARRRKREMRQNRQDKLTRRAECIAERKQAVTSHGNPWHTSEPGQFHFNAGYAAGASPAFRPERFSGAVMAAAHVPPPQPLVQPWMLPRGQHQNAAPFRV